MTKLFHAAPIALAIAVTPAFAQSGNAQTAEQALVDAFTAEHEAWMEDHERWSAEHDEAICMLQAAVERLETYAPLDEHEEMIDSHGDMLSAANLPDVAGDHARARSRYEEMRESHHHLMDAVGMLSAVLNEDPGPAQQTDVMSEDD